MARWAKCFLGKHEVLSLDPAQLLSAFTIPELEEGADMVRPRGCWPGSLKQNKTE